jgi:tetratricopeptide (TPR) repeat protein
MGVDLSLTNVNEEIKLDHLPMQCYSDEKIELVNQMIDIYKLILNDQKLKEAAERAVEYIRIYLKFGNYFLTIIQYASLQSLYLRKIEDSLQFLEYYKNNGGYSLWYILKKGVISQYNEMYQDAASLFIEVLEESQYLNDRKMEGLAIYHLGIQDRIHGKYSSARERYENSISIFHDINDRYHEGMVLSSLGIINRLLQKNEDAINCYNKSLNIFIDMGDNYRRACVQGRMGTAFRSLGELEKAIASYHAALSIFLEIGDKTREGFIRKELGTAFFIRGEWDKALQEYENALKMITQLYNPSRKDRSREGQVHYNIGITHMMKLNWKEAIISLNIALFIFKDIEDNYYQSETLNAIGTIYRMRDDFNNSLRNYEAALALSPGDLLKKACLRGKIGNVYRMLHDFNNAEKFLKESLENLNASGEVSIDSQSRKGWMLSDLTSPAFRHTI